MSPPSRQQLRAVLRLREMVLSGQLKCGERIPELLAVSKLGMSRTPVRMALNILEHEGLLESSSHGGFVVRDFSVAEIMDAIELRGVLEGTAARFAAERHSGPAALAPLTSVVAQLDELLADGGHGAATFETYIELNALFHARLLDLAGSEMLRRAMAHAVALPFASPNAFLNAQFEGPQSRQILEFGQDQHRALVEAISAREGARAEALAREHARLARRNLNVVLDRGELFARVPGSSLLRDAALHLPARGTSGSSDAA